MQICAFPPFVFTDCIVTMSMHANFVTKSLKFPTCLLSDVLLAIILGRAITVYLLKDFRIQHQGKAVLMDLTLTVVLSYRFYSGLIAAFSFLMFTDFCYITTVSNRIKLAVTVITVYAVQNLNLSPEVLYTGVNLVATSQMFRYPTWLGTLLRNPRLILGPVYPILLLKLAIIQPIPEHVLAATCGLVASLILRPDNTEVLQYIPGISSNFMKEFSKRRRIHGLLMFVALIISSLDFKRQFLKVQFIFNILLYFMVKLVRP